MVGPTVSAARQKTIVLCLRLLSAGVTKLYVLQKKACKIMNDDARVEVYDHSSNDKTRFDFAIVSEGQSGLNKQSAEHLQRMIKSRKAAIAEAEKLGTSPIPCVFRCLHSEHLLKAVSEGSSGLEAIDKEGVCFSPKVPAVDRKRKRIQAEGRVNHLEQERAMLEKEEQMPRTVPAPAAAPSNNSTHDTTTTTPLNLQEILKMCHEPPPIFSTQQNPVEVLQARARFLQSVHRQLLEDLKSEAVERHTDQVMENATQ